eukprot:m.193693 g.193693  ORF g.193693 m.193693 type:complete len:136 (-) comp16783_c2_seq11:1643-2050(-)
MDSLVLDAFYVDDCLAILALTLLPTAFAAVQAGGGSVLDMGAFRCLLCLSGMNECALPLMLVIFAGVDRPSGCRITRLALLRVRSTCSRQLWIHQANMYPTFTIRFIMSTWTWARGIQWQLVFTGRLHRLPVYGI